jgi:membrane-associated phospholipid phosphatase
MKHLILIIAFFYSSDLAAQFRTDSLKHAPSTFDERLFWDINHLSDTSSALDKTMLVASNSVLPLAIATPISFMAYGIGKHDAQATYDGFTIGAATATTIVFQELLVKQLVRRERPFRVIEDTRWIDSGVHGFSFPSSHSAISFGLATALSLRYPYWYVVAPSYLYAAIVTFSRPYLGVHFPTDILAGAIIGSLIQYAAYRIEYTTAAPGFIRDLSSSPMTMAFSVPIK